MIDGAETRQPAGQILVRAGIEEREVGLDAGAREERDQEGRQVLAVAIAPLPHLARGHGRHGRLGQPEPGEAEHWAMNAARGDGLPPAAAALDCALGRQRAGCDLAADQGA